MLVVRASHVVLSCTRHPAQVEGVRADTRTVVFRTRERARREVGGTWHPDVSRAGWCCTASGGRGAIFGAHDLTGSTGAELRPLAVLVRVLVEQEVRAAASRRQGIVRVVEPATLEGKAPTADAVGKSISQPLQGGDLLIEAQPEALGQSCPVSAIRGAPAGQRSEGVADVSQTEPYLLSSADEGDSSQGRAHVMAVTGRGPDRADQTLVVVETDGGHGHAAAGRHLPDGQLVASSHPVDAILGRA